MDHTVTIKQPTRQDIMEMIMALLNEIKPGWEIEHGISIGPETCFGKDLGISSLNFVRLLNALRIKFGVASLPFHKLFVSNSGGIIPDITFARLIDFLCSHAL